MSDINSAVEKIKECISVLPGTWAETIAERMGCSVASVRAYARFANKRKPDRTIEVLSQLRAMVEEQNQTISKLVS